MRRVAPVALVLALAVAGCGDDEGGGEPTKEQAIEVMRETQPGCRDSARFERETPESAPAEIGFILCDKAPDGRRRELFWSSVESTEDADRYAEAGRGQQLSFVANGVVIQPKLIDDPENFIAKLRDKCGCEFERY